jgi:hypothetical protein
MRYYVTIATPATGYVTVDVNGPTEEEAKRTAASRFLAKHSRLSWRDVTVAKIVEIGSSPPRKRRVRPKARLAG